MPRCRPAMGCAGEARNRFGEGWMRTEPRRPIWLLFATAMSVACAPQTPEVRELCERHLAASDAHDLGIGGR